MTTINAVGNGLSGASGTGKFIGDTNSTLTNVTLVTPDTLGVQQQALNMNSNQINNLSDPSLAQDAATKNYVDNSATGGAAPCVAATTGALTVTYNNGVAGVGATLTNAGTQVTFALDGQSPTVGQRVLIKNQGSTFQNGVYTVTNVGSGATNWVLTRATDYDTAANINNTGVIPVLAGTVNINTGWLNTTVMITVGMTAITYIQFGVSFPVSLANGGTGQSLSSVNSAVFSTTSGGAGQLSTTLPSGLSATNISLTTPTLGVAGATSINFGGSTLSTYTGYTAFTPTITFQTAGDLSVAYASQVGQYVRIGDLVWITILLSFTPTYTTASGNFIISSLPVLSHSSASNIGTAVITTSATWPTGITQVFASQGGSTNNLTLLGVGSGKSAANFTVTQFPSGTAVGIQINMVYSA